MSNVYIVTDEEGDYQREYPSRPPRRDSVPSEWAYDAEDAAQMWAAEAWPHYDCPGEMVCLVTSPGETESVRYTVTVESEPVFSARRDQ